MENTDGAARCSEPLTHWAGVQDTYTIRLLNEIQGVQSHEINKKKKKCYDIRRATLRFNTRILQD